MCGDETTQSNKFGTTSDITEYTQGMLGKVHNSKSLWLYRWNSEMVASCLTKMYENTAGKEQNVLIW